MKKDFRYICRQYADRVLVTMGGSDPFQLTELVAEGLDLIEKPLQVTYVLGGGFSAERIDKLKLNHQKTIHKITYSQSIPNMAETMAEQDLAVINGGITRFELALIGVPFFSISINAKQDQISSFLENNGIGKSLGCFQKCSAKEISFQINSFLENHSKRYSLSQKQKSIIDPLGVKRIFKILKNG